jgi:transcriptional regulator with XRE-family HTH domain
MNGEALKLLRQYHCMKGVELGRVVGISPSHMSGIENHLREVPLTAIYAYAKYFEVTIEGIEELAQALKTDDLMTLQDAKLQRIYQWWLDVKEYRETP